MVSSMLHPSKFSQCKLQAKQMRFSGLTEKEVKSKLFSGLLYDSCAGTIPCSKLTVSRNRDGHRRNAGTLRNYKRGRNSRLFRSFLQGWVLELKKSWLEIVLTADLSEWFYSPKPFLQKGSQSSEVENRGKDKIEGKAFQGW